MNNTNEKIAKINEYFADLSSWTEEYYTGNTDNRYAEYVLSAGYSEHLKDVASKLISRIEEKYYFTDSELKVVAEYVRENIKNIVYCYGSAEYYFGCDDGTELCYIQIHEIEEQIDDSIVDLIESLTEEEREQIEFGDFYYKCGFAYFTLYGGWELEIDDEELINYLEKSGIISI